jgi:hypothetical protein
MRENRVGADPDLAVRPEFKEFLKSRFHVVEALWIEAPLHETIELPEHLRGDRLEGAASGGEVDQGSAAVARIRMPLNKPNAFEPAHQLGHRLLAKTRPPGQLPHPESVLLEEGKEYGAVRGADVVEACGGEALR